MIVKSNECIASGAVYEDDTMSLVASVYETVYINDESASMSASAASNSASDSADESTSHYVVMSYKNLDADEEPMDSMSWSDVMNEVAARAEASGSGSNSNSASGEGELAVPGTCGGEAVSLSEPKAIRYSKTKSFVSRDAHGVEHVNVYCAMRYEY